MKLNRSFGMKLVSCFMLFTLIIFTLLWLLQTVFLQSFYTKMVVNNVKKSATLIIQNKNDDNLAGIINKIAQDNSLLIFLTDLDGNILFNADEHSSAYENTSKVYDNSRKQNSNPYLNSSKQLNWQLGMFRNLPQGYADFLKKISSTSEKEISYLENDEKSFVYGTVLADSKFANNKDAILYINTKIEAVGGAITIIRTQLIWCTLVSVLIAFVIAFFFAKQFSVPIMVLTKDASTLAQGIFNLKFSKGFCLELDQLSDALQKTSHDLQKLESSRKELLANISHDLRTPLTMIKGYAEMLKEFSWSDEAKREQDLSIIIKETDRLSDLVNDILSYSTIQDSTILFENKKLNISETVKFVIGQFLPMCQKNNLFIEEKVQDDLFVVGDEKQLKRVIYNFIDNAISHSEGNKKISIVLKKIENRNSNEEYSQKAENNSITNHKTIYFEVRNYGKPIPYEMQDKIWDRYFTARQQRAEGPHSGLGLSISKEILTKSNAMFGVKSEEDKGTIFWFAI